jgi:hypothetical protein
MITNRTENIKIDQLADMTLSFKAIGWADERAPKEVDGIGDPVDVDGTSSLGKLTDKVKNLF